MKKLIIVAGVIAVLSALLMGAYRAGIRHAMLDSEFWILEYEDYSPYDYRVHVRIDGEWYEHGIYVG